MPLKQPMNTGIKDGKLVIDMIEAAGREEVTDTRDWDEAEGALPEST